MTTHQIDEKKAQDEKKNDPVEWYFAYGSNMNRQRMDERVGSESYTERLLASAASRGYRLAFDKQAAQGPGVGYANLSALSFLSIIARLWHCVSIVVNITS